MKICVTQDDIDCGTPGDSNSCPVALAIERIVDDGWSYVEVYGDIAEIYGSTVYLPPSVEIFVNEFDNGRPVCPFEFDLDYIP